MEADGLQWYIYTPRLGSTSSFLLLSLSLSLLFIPQASGSCTKPGRMSELIMMTALTSRDVLLSLRSARVIRESHSLVFKHPSGRNH